MTPHESDRAIELKYEAFELAWLDGTRPDVHEFLAEVDVQIRDQLALRLIPADIRFRQRLGENVLSSDYSGLGEGIVRFADSFLEHGSTSESMKVGSVATDSTALHQSPPAGEQQTTDVAKVADIRSGETISLTKNLQFGDYVLIDEIARGGMGVVYRARQTKLKRTVALKMILAGRLASDQEIQRFYAEAESAAQLEHPGIVQIYEVGQVGDQHFFSMAFVEGRSLAEATRQGPLAPENAANYAGQIASAISYAHTKNVIHRDLKPANVLLDQQGCVKVTDFGLAKQTHLDTQLTETGQIMGTPGYMPPEQASGQLSRVDETSDVYAIGAILYCLITGRPPFQAATPMETLAQVIERDPVAPRALVPGIPRDLETICLKCLEKEQHRRYPSALELAADIDRFRNNQPILARPVSRLERAVRWTRKQRQPLWIATLTGLAVALLLIVGLIGRFAYQQSLLGYVDLRTNEEEGYLVATIFDENQQQIERQTLPTQQPIALTEGSYRVRLSGARRMSKDVQLEVENRSQRRQPYSPEFSLKDTELWPSLKHEGVVVFSNLSGNRDDAILWDQQSVARIDGSRGTTIWKTEISAALEEYEIPGRFRWWNNFDNLINKHRSLRFSPKLLQPSVDLDGDGIRDLVFSGSEQAWLLALSGDHGHPLWFRTLFSVDSDAPRRVDFGNALLDSAVIHPPTAIADVDQDGIMEILAVVFDLGEDRTRPPSRWLELTSGRTGEQIWKRGLDGSWFDERHVPMDFRWLHFGSSVTSEGNSAGDYYYSRDRSSVYETGSGYFSTSPILFPTDPDARQLMLVAGDRLLQCEPDSGKLKEFSLGFTPIKSPEVADIDGDGVDELLFLVESDSSELDLSGLEGRAASNAIAPTELIVWSIAKGSISWRRQVFATWGAVRKLGREVANWPLAVDLNDDGKLEIVIPDETSHDGSFSRPSTFDKPFGGLSVFDASGELIWTQTLISKREQLDRFIVGPDINDDGWHDLFVVTDDARKDPGRWDQKAILVDAISGCDGQRIWWNQVLGSGNQEFEYGESIDWWNPGNDGWPQLLVGIRSDLFAFSARTGDVTGYGHYIDSVQIADANGDQLDDLFFLRHGNLGSYRGRPPVNWMRSPMKIQRSSDVNADGVCDFAFGNKIVSGIDGATLWQSDQEMGPYGVHAPDEEMIVLNHDLNGDGFHDVLANGDWKLRDRTFAKLLSGKSGRRLWAADGEFSEHGVRSAKLLEAISDSGPGGSVELTVIAKESRSVFNGKYDVVEPGHTWLMRLDGKSGKLKWKTPLFAHEFRYDGLKLLNHDLNGDGVLDVLTAARAETSAEQLITNGRLELRAYDGIDGTVIWTSPVVQLDDSQCRSFPKLTVVDTKSHGAIVTFYDHRDNTTNLRVIRGATGQARNHPIHWTEPMPETTHNRIELPQPIVIENHNTGEYFFAMSVWSNSLGPTTDWKGEALPTWIAEEFLMITSEGEIVTRFGLPLVLGNQFRANRQRIWSYDTDQDGVDELIFLDVAGLTAIDPFGKKLIWSWKRPGAFDLHLHTVLDNSRQPAVGVVRGDREVFGINLSNGNEQWIASDKSLYRDPWSREEIHILDFKDRNPRILFLNDQESVCVSARSTAIPFNGDRLPVPLERTAARDPRFFRYLPWVESNPFARQLDPQRDAFYVVLELLACLPMLTLFFVIPWFWLKRIVRARRFSIRSLLMFVVLISIGLLIFSPRGNQVLQRFSLQYENLSTGLVLVLPMLVFFYSLIRIFVLGQWQMLAWMAALNFVLVVGCFIAALVAIQDFAPNDIYVFDHGWTLILWLIYITGVALILFEIGTHCWSLIRSFANRFRRDRSNQTSLG